MQHESRDNHNGEEAVERETNQKVRITEMNCGGGPGVNIRLRVLVYEDDARYRGGEVHQAWEYNDPMIHSVNDAATIEQKAIRQQVV